MRTILRAERLLVDARADLLRDAAICVEDDKIVQVGTAAEVGSFARDAAVHELGDATVMPGMFDCHVHLSFDGEKADIHEVPSDARVVMASNAFCGCSAAGRECDDHGDGCSCLGPWRRAARASAPMGGQK